jgi:adenylosuccinate lyase
MNTSTINALSPLDGRYASKLEGLRLELSEFGYMRRREQVEVTWLMALSQAGLHELPRFEEEARRYLLSLFLKFSMEDALAIKDIEKTTNHDVKAVEYWIKAQLSKNTLSAKAQQSLLDAVEWVHFSLTSEDINNCSHALMLQAARDEVLNPALLRVTVLLREMVKNFAHVPMLSRTHGQTASPTTVGKEMANVLVRLERALERLGRIELRAKMNGAVGNYNAQVVAYPEVDWQQLAQQVIEGPVVVAGLAPERVGLGLHFQAYSTQIEPHDTTAEVFDALAHLNVIAIDCCRDLWGYISLGYFKQRLKEGEIGSSTMPHKVNPIDFENAEGNLGLANALLRHMSDKLPISRFQRDLSDSTVIRNVGVALGHALLAYQSLAAGLQKLEINEERLAEDLGAAWEVLAEPIQTVMRRYGLTGAYEQLKAHTRGKKVTQEDLHGLIAQLAIPQDAKDRLLALSPERYIGLAEQLALESLVTPQQVRASAPGGLSPITSKS